jgi:hypothetical protein
LSKIKCCRKNELTCESSSHRQQIRDLCGIVTQDRTPTTLYFPAEFKALMEAIAIRSCGGHSHHNHIVFSRLKGG